MTTGMSKPNRRTAVIINYLCIVLFLALFAAGRYYGWSLLIGAGIAAVLLVAVISFVLLHLRTRLWRLVHTRIDDLDEREVHLTHESLRHSYAIFTIISLIVLLVIAVLAGADDAPLVLIFAALLYLAHTLPSSIIAWTEREV